MELRDRDAPLTLFSSEPILPGRSLALGKEESQHGRVRRAEVGERVRVVDGCGAVGLGTLVRLTKSQVSVRIETAMAVDPPSPIHLLVPIADRDRMLLLAEKAAELGVSSWRPVLWQRSRSVVPRGEGVTFQGKVRGRMVSALKQSGGAWLPTLFPDATLEHAIAASPDGTRFLLDAIGLPMLSASAAPPAVVALGPEGGFEPYERDALLAASYTPVSLGSSILRFETAGIVALGVLRAAGHASSEVTRG